MGQLDNITQFCDGDAEARRGVRRAEGDRLVGRGGASYTAIEEGRVAGLDMGDEVAS